MIIINLENREIFITKYDTILNVFKLKRIINFITRQSQKEGFWLTNAKKKHLKINFINIINKIMKQFNCKICNYYAKDNYNLQRHYDTNKHLNNKKDIGKLYNCLCKKSFSHQSSLTRHKKKCLEVSKNDNLDIQMLKEELQIVKEVLAETVQLNQQILQNQQQIITTNNNHNNYVNNTTNNINNNINFNFNYTIKLNEKFPDALTMNDFISLVEDSCGDLTKIATKPSFISQVSRMICDKMSELDTENRPLHFINHAGEDAFYMKDGEGWDKASHEKIGNKIESTARGISKVHFAQWNKILDSIDEYPDEWTKQINHVTKEVTPEELNKGISKLKKVINLNKKLLT